MAQDKGMRGGGEGDCAVRIFFDQDADRHCLCLTLRGKSVVGDSGMSDAFSVIQRAGESISRGCGWMWVSTCTRVIQL